MPILHTHGVVPQLFVPGCGVEDLSTEEHGEVVPDSLQSYRSYERAVTAAQYATLNPDVRHVIFSGNVSLFMPEGDIPSVGEASAMANVAVREGLNHTKVKVEKKSDTVMTSWLNCLEGETPLLDDREPIGVVAHRDQMPRIVHFGRFVDPQAMLVPIYVSGDFSKPGLAEYMKTLLYTVTMHDVQAGDREAIRHREERAKHFLVATHKAFRIN